MTVEEQAITKLALTPAMVHVMLDTILTECGSKQYQYALNAFMNSDSQFKAFAYNHFIKIQRGRVVSGRKDRTFNRVCVKNTEAGANWTEDKDEVIANLQLEVTAHRNGEIGVTMFKSKTGEMVPIHERTDKQT